MTTSITPGSAASTPSLTPLATAANTGGGATAPPSLATAIADLTQAVSALSAAVQALAGASQVAGGGPTTNAAGGCSCGSGAAEGAAAGAANGVTGGGATGAPSTVPTQGSPSIPGSTTPTSPATPAPPAAGAPSSSVRDKILAAARGELAKNVTEDAGANEDRAGNIKKYRAAVTGGIWADGRGPEEWCADFASWVWKDAGAAFGPKGTGEANTSNMIQQAKELGSWKTNDPKPGDMVLFDWGGARGTPDEASVVDHVAIVDRVENGTVYVIGGNQSDALTAVDYGIDDKHILGYVNPPGA
ncbi:MAG: hypothetical protein JWN72_2015 [Thermoleophilia bacterium]|nr:hypothetical protein [Thermoleophilia bacterium]